MQTTSSQYDLIASGDLRPLAWAFYAAMDKRFDNSIDFFTLDTSILDGADILAQSEDNVLTEWDKYVFRSYTERVMQMEWVREEDVPYSVNMAFADIVLRNNDNFFTYGARAKTASFADNLEAQDLDYWFIYGSLTFNTSGMTVAIPATAAYGGVSSQYAYSLRSSSVSVEVSNAGNQSLSSLQVLIQLLTTNNQNAVLWVIEQDTLVARRVVNGTPIDIDDVTYDPVDHAWLRIRESAGTLYFDTSADGLSWTNFTTELVSNMGVVFDLDDIAIDLLAGTYDDEGVTSSATFANLNLTGAGARVAASSSPIANYNIPRRPIRLLGGFANITLPQFVGLTDSTPKVDRQARTATLHAEDFLSFIFNKPLDQAVMLENVKTDAVLTELFTLVGLDPSQYVLDEAYNEIAFLYFERGKKLGEAVRELMQAELGSLFMDELGIIRFQNRVRQTDSPVQSFDSSNIVDYQVSDDSKIINLVEVKADVREVQSLQEVFSLAAAIPLPAGTSEIFFNFDDPVTTLDTIDDYTANTAEDGSGSNITGNITVTDTDLFTNAVKVTFSNSGSAGFLTSLTIFGTPAKVVKSIYLTAQDDDSITQFEEQPLTIENNFIQSDDAANSLALSLINYYKDYASTIELEVKGNFALQVGDTIHVNVDNIDSDFNITKIINTLEPTRFRQIIHARVYNIPAFFILDESELDSEDVLAP